jgi:hypothetical protein
MTWDEYLEKIKSGPISVLLNPPTAEDCDKHGKFLAFFPKENQRPPTWGYLSINYIEKNNRFLQPKEGESGHFPLHLICSHWLPIPPLVEDKK